MRWMSARRRGRIVTVPPAGGSPAPSAPPGCSTSAGTVTTKVASPPSSRSAVASDTSGFRIDGADPQAPERDLLHHERVLREGEAPAVELDPVDGHGRGVAGESRVLEPDAEIEGRAGEGGGRAARIGPFAQHQPQQRTV